MSRKIIATYYIEDIVSGSPYLQICEVSQNIYGFWWADGDRLLLDGGRFVKTLDEAKKAIISYYGLAATPI